MQVKHPAAALAYYNSPRNACSNTAGNNALRKAFDSFIVLCISATRSCKLLIFPTISFWVFSGTSGIGILERIGCDTFFIVGLVPWALL